jgi:hypothetical protein
LHAHFRGDTNWQPADSTITPLTATSFTLSVSPSTFGIIAGSPASGTVTITPSGGFTGTVALTCATGGTFLPAGYACSFGQASVPVNNATATTALNLTPISTATAGVKSASVHGDDGAPWGAGFGAGLLLLGLVFLGTGGGGNSKNFLAACGLVLCVASAVGGCGMGGGGGVGPVSTTTTLTSSNLHAAYGTPVTFTVTVTPHGSATPSGAVQLYDNGQVYGSPVIVSAGIASFFATTLPVGVHSFTADYRGDANTQASTSVPITQVITGTVGLQITGTGNGIIQTADFSVMVN